MAIDNQPAPSSESAPSDAQASASRSSELADVSINTDPSWWRRLLGRGRGDVQVEAPPAAADAPPEQPASKTVTLTEEELQERIQRGAQAEADRRESRRQQQAQLEERRRKRREDPIGYAADDEQAEQQQAVSQQAYAQRIAELGQIGAQYDRAVLDPIVYAVPEAERQRILGLENAGMGLEGRKLLMTESLKALEAHWKAQGAREAEQRLRRNPSFRKQVLAELRGQQPEPELLLGTPEGNGHDENVSDILRASIGYGPRR